MLKVFLFFGASMACSSCSSLSGLPGLPGQIGLTITYSPVVPTK